MFLSLTLITLTAQQTAQTDLHTIGLGDFTVNVFSILGRNGATSIAIYQGKERLEKLNVKYPPQTWLEADDLPDRPSTVVRKWDRGTLTVDLVLHSVSGVYGFRELVTVTVFPDREKKFATTNSYAFSDMGSFARLNQSEIIGWDYIYADDECHRCPHKYKISLIKTDDRKSEPTKTWTSQQKYQIESNDQVSPSIDQTRQPLSEWGLNWLWWGEQPSAAWQETFTPKLI